MKKKTHKFKGNTVFHWSRHYSDACIPKHL